MRLWLPAICIFLSFGSVALGASRSQRERGAAVFAASGCGHCHTIQKGGRTQGTESFQRRQDFDEDADTRADSSRRQ